MQLTDRPIGEIKPYPKNAKNHPEKQIKKIASSIAAFGFNQPIVTDKEGVIIVGHGRYLAAHLLGISHVPVITLDLTEEQAKAYRLADNKLNESDWEMDLVLEELKSLSLEMVDLTGFDPNLILETKEDKPDLSTVGAPKTKSGDIYQLGRHRLMCGDSEAPETYKKLLGEEKARLIFTDPPYSVDYVSGLGVEEPSSKFKGGGRIMGDNRSPADALKFYKSVLNQLKNFTTDDVSIYWWFATSFTEVNMQAFREAGWHWSQTVIWLKNSLVYSMGQLFHRIYEPCMIGWKEGKSPYRNRNFSSFTELWNLDQKKFADYLDIWYQKRDNVAKYIHPTQKPVQLAERALKRSSEKGDIVLDAFGGSGSTLIACEQMDRQCRMIELDPKYCDAIVGRYLKFTEQTHVIKNGKDILW